MAKAMNLRFMIITKVTKNFILFLETAFLELI